MSNDTREELKAAGKLLATVVIGFGIYVAMCAVGDSVLAKEVTPQPESSVSFPCVVTDVYDGDTLTVTVCIPVRVRLLDCWADEIRTRDKEEKERGYASRDHLTEIAYGERAQLVVPFRGAKRLDDLFTFGRLLAGVYVDGRSVAELQVESGHAYRTKRELREATATGKDGNK